MKRDEKLNTKLLRIEPDEVYPQKVRINGKLKTIRKFVLIYAAFPSRVHNFVYYKDGEPVVTGKISKTEVFTAMRRFAVE